MIDANNDGWIERGELEDVMIIAADEMGIERPNKEEIKEIMKELDKNGKGKLTKDDFMVLVLQVLKLLKKYEPISSEWALLCLNHD